MLRNGLSIAAALLSSLMPSLTEAIEPDSKPYIIHTEKLLSSGPLTDDVWGVIAPGGYLFRFAYDVDRDGALELFVSSSMEAARSWGPSACSGGLKAVDGIASAKE